MLFSEGAEGARVLQNPREHCKNIANSCHNFLMCFRASRKNVAKKGSGAFGERGTLLLGDVACVVCVYTRACTPWLTRERAETWREAAECKNCQGASPIKSSRNWRRSEREQVVSPGDTFQRPRAVAAWQKLVPGRSLYAHRVYRLQPGAEAHSYIYTGCLRHASARTSAVSHLATRSIPRSDFSLSLVKKEATICHVINATFVPLQIVFAIIERTPSVLPAVHNSEKLPMCL